jgi:methylenetetrahydrofolate dehydrogenase (NADP+)/methenyltetrahydrofolate cyclohydrolase
VIETKLLTGKPLADGILKELSEEIRALNLTPTLATILVGENPSSHLYVRRKTEAAKRIGIAVRDYVLPASLSEGELLELVHQLNRDEEVDGILLQLPLPPPLDPERILSAMDPHKDVDGFHPLNLGLLLRGREGFLPCTPQGVIELIRSTGIGISGKRALVIGRSLIVGRPTALLLLEADATVTIAHSRTLNLRALVEEAEILVVAVGRPHFLSGSWVRQGAVVIDVGVNRTKEGKVVGDLVTEEAFGRASWITPVPGGVGPLTIAYLMKNTVLAHKRRRGIR